MSDNLYSFRESQNNQKFDQLAQTLHSFRTTVNDDIHGALQQESSTLDALNDSLSSMMTNVRRVSSSLRTVMTRNMSLTKLVGGILLLFFIIWMLYKLK